jgi:peptidoglycan/xylan/chitin deacetylase (PgdA/CDA1 family)
MGVSRIFEIDTTGGPQFGSQHLRPSTMDPGRSAPWPSSLQDECLKATFFEIGQPASWHPEIVDAGMTVGTHTWSHKDLARNPYAKDAEHAEREIEMGNSAVHSAAAGGKVAPFFRFPYLQQLPWLVSYLAERKIAIFSTDIDSRDFTMHKRAGDQFSNEPIGQKRQGYCPLARLPPQHRRSLAPTARSAKSRRL